MKKLLLLQVLYALLIIPALAARHPDPVRGVKWAMLLMVLFNLWYMFSVLFIWPKLEG